MLHKSLPVMFFFVFSLFEILLLETACTKRNSNSNNKNQNENVAKYITPQAAEGIMLSHKNTRKTSSVPQRKNESISGLKLILPENYHPIRILNIDLDTDEVEEQIIACKVRIQGQEEIHILVVDFDSLYDRFKRSWEHTIQATEGQSFSLSTEDLTGDHIKEIIATGIGQEGNKTIDIFRMSTQPGKRNIQYYSVLSLTASGGIEIIRVERSTAYKNHQIIGKSFSIVTYDQNEVEGEGVQTSLSKQSYYWNMRAEKFIPGAKIKIPFTLKDQEHYAKLFNANINEFIMYLSGMWQNTKNPTNIVYFDVAEKQILFSTRESQQWYVWNHAYKTILRAGPGISLQVSNELISAVKKTILVAVSSIKTIEIAVEGSSQLNGKFKKMGLKEQENAFQSWHKKEVSPLIPQLDGIYKNLNRQEIYFSYPTFKMRNQKEELSGSYYVSFADKPILELNILDQKNNFIKHLSYIIEYKVDKKKTYETHTLVLIPAKIMLSGANRIPGEILNLEQKVR